MITLPINSRFHATEAIREQDGSVSWSLWNPSLRQVNNETLYVITTADLDRPDLIAARAYGNHNVSLWWAILYYNNIHDPFSLQVGDRIVIPDITTIPEVSKSPVSHEPSSISRVPVLRSFTIPSFLRVSGVNALDEEVIDTTPPTGSSQTGTFQFSFPAPKCESGLVHFEAQIATDDMFSNVVFSSSTESSPSAWQFYNSFLEQPSYTSFPPYGLEISIFGGSYVFTTVEGLTTSQIYFRRYRAILLGTPRAWTGLPPQTLL